MPRTPYRVLFVCLGNICRSPAAENILRHLAKEHRKDTQIQIDSAGTHDYNIGKKPDTRMTRALATRGIPNPGRARQFTAHDFQDFDLIVAMDSENRENIRALDPDRQYTPKVVRMTDYCQQPAHQIPDVPDPYYGGTEGFEFVTDLLLDGCTELLKGLCQETKS